MRKDEFRQVEQRWARRDLFGQRRRRRVPWAWILMVVALVAAGVALTRTDLGALLSSFQSLLPESSDSEGKGPKADPNSLPLLPLPPAPQH